MAMMQVKFLLMCGCILPALAKTGPLVSISLAPLNRVLNEGATNLKLLGETASRLLFFPDQNIDNKAQSRTTDEILQTKTRTSTPTTTAEVTSATAEKTVTAICSSSSTSINHQCEPNLKNLAVYEGQLDIMMNLLTDPRIVTWSVQPSSDELNLQNIIDIGCIRNPSLVDLYDVKEIGLVIKKAMVAGDPISTAGLYVGKCVDSTDNVGAKLLVIRTGPQCSRTSIDTSSSGVSCNITFADSVIHPIRPIVTWKLNGEFLSSSTLQMVRIDAVFYAESSIATNGGANDNYQCEVTFDAPTEIMYPWIATNAPEFKDSCSITG